jgi:hypothetical protein
MSNSQQAVNAVKKWLASSVIALDFCPFAAFSMQQQAVRFVATASASKQQLLELLINECLLLDAESSLQTTLIVLDGVFLDFDDYLELLDAAEQLLQLQGYEGVYQLASFHPDYCFADAAEDDAANYTNRSPWPILHLLRESAIDDALAHYKDDPELIPERNIALCEEKGLDYMKALLLASKK